MLGPPIPTEVSQGFEPDRSIRPEPIRRGQVVRGLPPRGEPSGAVVRYRIPTADRVSPTTAQSGTPLRSVRIEAWLRTTTASAQVARAVRTAVAPVPARAAAARTTAARARVRAARAARHLRAASGTALDRAGSAAIAPATIVAAAATNAGLPPTPHRGNVQALPGSASLARSAATDGLDAAHAHPEQRN